MKIKCLCHKKHRNPLEFHKASAPEPSGTSQGICTGTLRNLTKHLLRQSPPEPHKVSAPEPSGTSQGICPEPSTTSPRIFTKDPPEPSGTSSGSSCTGNFRSLTRYLHQNPPEPCPEPGVEAAPDHTGASLG